MSYASERPGSAGEHLLQDKYGTQARAEKFYDEQALTYLNEQMREFVGEQEMMFVATSDAYGECDCTFRAGSPGFVRVLDERTLAYPEYRGNGVMASLGNVFENAQVGLLFVDFFTYRIGLHVNGSAQIVESDDMRRANPELFEAGDDTAAERWVAVSVHEAYIHCSKRIPLLAKPDPERDGANGVKRNGGDFFGVKTARESESTREHVVNAHATTS